MIETDLHEWMANKNYVYEDDARAGRNYREFVAYKGGYPADQDLDWEDMLTMRKRILPVLHKYKRYPKVIVVPWDIYSGSLQWISSPKRRDCSIRVLGLRLKKIPRPYPLHGKGIFHDGKQKG